MIIVVYLVYDCVYNVFFKKIEYNICLGKLLNWIIGGSYGIYEDLCYKYMCYYVDNVDLIFFDY